jgi:hypothetical protein
MGDIYTLAKSPLFHVPVQVVIKYGPTVIGLYCATQRGAVDSQRATATRHSDRWRRSFTGAVTIDKLKYRVD